MEEYILNELTSSETAVVTLLCIIIFIILQKQFSAKNIYSFGSPLTVLCLVTLYYCIIGPVLSIWNNDTLFRSIEHRPYYLTSWVGVFIFFISCLIGYQFVGNVTLKKQHLVGARFDIDYFKDQVYICYGIGFACYILLAGTGGLSAIAFWKQSSEASESLVDAGGFSAYIMNGFNFMIVACPGIVYLYQKKKISPVVAISLLFVAFSLFISGGFRWRLVIAALSCLSMWYISINRKVNIVVLGIGGFVFLVFMGVMEASRSYGKGLDLSSGKQKTVTEYLSSGFNETAVFKASGLVMSRAGVEFEYIGMDPIIQALVAPIPRLFWPNKPTGDYLIYLRESYTRTNKNEGVGQAVLNYCEYYMMGGWITVVLMGIFVGWFYGKINKPLIQSNNSNVHPWYISFCLLNAAYMYVVLSRGYTPQQFMFYFFTVYPAWYFYRRSIKQGKA